MRWIQFQNIHTFTHQNITSYPFLHILKIVESYQRILKKELDWKPIYNKKFLKTKIRSYGDEAADFHDKELPKVGSNCSCLAVMFCCYKKMKTVILKCFLKKCKYNVKEKKKVIRHIADDVYVSSDGSDES